MANLHHTFTIFIELQADLDTSLPDGTQVFCKDTNNLWVLDNGVYVLTGGAGGSTNVNGLNTYTGGTSALQTINVSALTIDNIFVSGTSRFDTLSASTLSATTYFSGSTPLTSIINNLITGTTSGLTGSVNINGLNTYTGGTTASQSINISGGTFDNIIVTGSTILSATTASTVTILNSGATIANVVDWNYNTIRTGVETSSIIGGSANTISASLRNVQILGGVGITAQTSDTVYVNRLTGTSIYGSTIYSGGTDLSLLFGAGGGGGSGLTSVQNGLNTYTGGTAIAPTVNISGGSFNNISASGGSFFNYLSATTITGTTVYGASIFSGNTNIETIYLLKTGTNRITVGTSTPTGPTTGDLWVDTN